MKLRDFKIGWRFLVQDPAYSTVVVLGLSIGFAACFLLLGYVRYSLSYDSAVPDAQRIYLVKNKFNIGKPMWLETTPLAYLDVAQASGLVDSVSAIQPLRAPVKLASQIQMIDLSAVHASFPQMFGITALAGDLQMALTRPDALALTESTARTLFGNTNVISKTLQINDKSYLVAALLADPPSNSTIQYAALAGINTSVWNDAERKSLLTSWSNIGGARIYLKLKTAATAAALEKNPARSVRPFAPAHSTAGGLAARYWPEKTHGDPLVRPARAIF